MASGIFAILDDIAALMDDVAAASKIAASKTAGILGDDLAVNAEKATGFVSSREIPVLWEITKGSLWNKVIIVPIALVLNESLPKAITIILLLGGFYLAYEGVEKIVEFIFHRNKEKKEVHELSDIQPPEGDEKAKIKSAILTDFILSIEIIIIALGTVLQESLPVKILTVSTIAIIASIGVYGIVTLIVRMDDLGYKLIRRSKNTGVVAQIGKLLVRSLPVIIKTLSVVGTIALVLVAGGIFHHNIDFLHHVWPTMPATLVQTIFGLIGGLLTLLLVTSSKKVIGIFKK